MDNMGLPVASSLPLVDEIDFRRSARAHQIDRLGENDQSFGSGCGTCLGADVVCFSEGFMFSLGCIQALQCNENTCPTGITTHDPKLQKAWTPPSKPIGSPTTRSRCRRG
ncbi:MAG: hypothetical protein CM15mP103_10970 [Gammaproteobacteria bacterium]|nr:MAG: hypothetical protein CM15mP103_10970 [Gammaproteobacteria bacterium]